MNLLQSLYHYNKENLGMMFFEMCVVGIHSRMAPCTQSGIVTDLKYIEPIYKLIEFKTEIESIEILIIE